jgi:hypothetical protein
VPQRRAVDAEYPHVEAGHEQDDPPDSLVAPSTQVEIVYYINFCGGQWGSTVVSLPEGGRNNNGVHSARGSGTSSLR